MSETRKVTQATQQTINQCLDAMHVDYRLKLAPSSDAPALMAGRYGPVNSQQARYGYHFLTLLNYTAPKTEDQPSGDIEDAVHKCSANAEKKIPPLNDEGLPDKIKQQSYTESLNSAKTATAFKRWSGCMAKFGYSYSSPVAAMQDSKWNWSSKNPSQNEKAVALKDEECKQRATLIPTWFNAEVDLQKRQITLKKKELDAISNQIKLRAVAAHKILTEGSR
ncbi:hypothetical protein [Streptomyces sp. 8L]|uniref:hypothetical protein n=1 Tax=Streptomyces sp. 8L TaxID=2877242 RepID=UPI001CD3C8C0|nr:hypothetical protein [Streptomyces sp. 8L]MCA1224143.1 hypothetical protein [Streptomyces sp. 8L]